MLLPSPFTVLSPSTSSSSFILKKSFIPSITQLYHITHRNRTKTNRPFTTAPIFNMPQPLKASEVDSKTDPSVAKQWDDQTPKKQQIDEFYKTVDGLKIGLLTTIRDGIGPVSRSMAVAKVPSSFIQLTYLPTNTLSLTAVEVIES